VSYLKCFLSDLGLGGWGGEATVRVVHETFLIGAPLQGKASLSALSLQSGVSVMQWTCTSPVEHCLGRSLFCPAPRACVLDGGWGGLRRGRSAAGIQ
jgi:hypothetical protein